jgi:hypothetical protein
MDKAIKQGYKTKTYLVLRKVNRLKTKRLGHYKTFLLGHSLNGKI